MRSLLGTIARAQHVARPDDPGTRHTEARNAMSITATNAVASIGRLATGRQGKPTVRRTRVVSSASSRSAGTARVSLRASPLVRRASFRRAAPVEALTPRDSAFGEDDSAFSATEKPWWRAALDRAAFALSGDDARLGERRAAEAEAAAEAARLEVRATATRLETIVNEGIEGITESRDDDETRRDTPMSHQRITPSAAAVSEIHLSATPKKSAEARAFAADVAGAVRDTEETVTRDASVAAAAAALAKALVEGTTIPSSRNSEMSFGLSLIHI